MLLKIGVTASCLWLLVHSVDIPQLLALLQRVQIGWVMLAVVVFWLAQLASSLRCAYIARELGGKLDFSTSLRAHFVGLWFNQVLPTSLGGDVVKMAILQQRLGLGLAVRAGVLDRVSGLIFLMMTVALTLPLYRGILNMTQWLGVLVLVSGFLVALVLAVWLAHVIAARWKLPHVLDTLLQLLKDIWTFRRGRALWEQVWTSAIVHTNGIASYTLISLALGLPTPWLSYILLVPLVFLVALMPVSLAGWGVREVGAVWLFGLVAIPRESALAISVCYGLMLIIAALPGLVLFLGHRHAGQVQAAP
jgi:uncharacterized membrane protein YbhN (UPF0104 family)